MVYSDTSPEVRQLGGGAGFSVAGNDLFDHHFPSIADIQSPDGWFPVQATAIEGHPAFRNEGCGGAQLDDAGDHVLAEVELECLGIVCSNAPH